MKKIIGLFIILFAISTSLIYSQVDCNSCTVALTTAAARESFESLRKSDLTYSLSILFSKDETYWSSYDSSQSHSMEIEASYKIYSATFKDQDQTSVNKRSFADMKTFYEQNKFLQKSEYDWFKQETTNDRAYDSWIKCIEICHSLPGLVLFTRGDLNREAILLASIKPGIGITEQKKVLDIKYSKNIKIGANPTLKVGRYVQLYSTLSLTFERTDSLSAFITVLLNDLPEQTITLDPIQKTTRPRPTKRPFSNCMYTDNSTTKPTISIGKDGNTYDIACVDPAYANENVVVDFKGYIGNNNGGIVWSSKIWIYFNGVEQYVQHFRNHKGSMQFSVAKNIKIPATGELKVSIKSDYFECIDCGNRSLFLESPAVLNIIPVE